jgi:hypothetical protein
MTIVPFLTDNVFGLRDIQAMSRALEDVCAILNLADDDKSEKERLAKKSSPLRNKASAVLRFCVTAS